MALNGVGTRSLGDALPWKRVPLEPEGDIRGTHAPDPRLPKFRPLSEHTVFSKVYQSTYCITYFNA